MKADQAMGLVSAGSASRSFLARIPTLLARLGPIKASSAPSAKGVSKTLHAGYAVSHYSALELCSVIWICVPEAELDHVIGHLAMETPLHRTMIVICDAARESTAPNALLKAGARIATLNVVDESREKLFVGEGHPDTIRMVKRVLAEDQRKLIVLNSTAKPLYFAGVHLATHLLLPWVDAAVESLRAAGFSRREATEASEAQVRRVLRMYDNSGSKAWKGSAAVSLRKVLEHDLEILRKDNPRLARLYADGIRITLAHFSGSSAANV